MAKSASNLTTSERAGAKKAAGKASSKTGGAQAYRGAKVLGVTDDGVKILKGEGRSPNFTAKEIRAAIASARAGRNGQ